MAQLQMNCPYTIFLASDTSFSEPLFLGNKFWPGSPNLPCMFDYDVVRPCRVEYSRQHILIPSRSSHLQLTALRERDSAESDN